MRGALKGARPRHGADNRARANRTKGARNMKKVLRVLIASLLLAGSLSIYSLADGPSPPPCNPTTKACT
jgi:hypothetical protein